MESEPLVRTAHFEDDEVLGNQPADGVYGRVGRIVWLPKDLEEHTASELAVWRQTLDHFDSIRIGLTATPAAHTTAYFKDVVYRYEYERAVRELTFPTSTNPRRSTQRAVVNPSPVGP